MSKQFGYLNVLQDDTLNSYHTLATKVKRVGRERHREGVRERQNVERDRERGRERQSVREIEREKTETEL